MLDADDLAAFFGTDMPSYALATIGADQIAGLFRGPFQSALGFVDTNKPSFLCPSANVASVAEGTAVTIDAVGYSVASVEKDLTLGISRLILEAS